MKYIFMSAFCRCFFLFVFFNVSAGRFESSQELITLSEVPLSRRMSSMAEYCFSSFKEQGYMGIKLEAFKDPELNQFISFSHKNSLEDLLSFFQGYYRCVTKKVGHEEFFLFVSKHGARIQVDILVESNYHRINDIVSSFRGEALCSRKSICYNLSSTELPSYLSTPKYNGYVSFAERCYARFLTKQIQASLNHFLTLFVQKI